MDAILTRVVAVRDDDVARRIAYRAVMTMAAMQRHEDTSPGVAAILGSRLDALGRQLTQTSEGAAAGDGWASHVGALLLDEDKLLPVLEEREAVPAVPPGMPIGGSGGWFDE